MENSPQIAEEDEDGKDLKNPRSWLYEVTQKKDEEDKPSWFSRFIENKQEKPEDKPHPKLELIKNEVEVPEPTDVEEPEKPALELVPDEPLEEVQQVSEAEANSQEDLNWPKLVEAVQEDIAEVESDPVTDPVVENFLEKVADGEGPKTAFEEIMTELGVDENQIDTLQKQTTAESGPTSIYDDEPAQAITYETIPDELPEELQNGSVVQPRDSAHAFKQTKQENTTKVIAEKPADPAAQPKLEQQHNQIKQEIVEKVNKIREVVAEKVAANGPTVVERFTKVKESTEVAEEQAMTEASEPQAKPERIGHMVIDAESKPSAVKPEAQTDEVIDNLHNYEGDPLADRKLETLNRTELLALSEKIIIDGSSLRQIFETHLIGERGLRRIIREHLRGGDLKKALQMEIVEREIDFERDPVVRDIPAEPHPHESNSLAVEPAPNLNRMVKKASAQIQGNNEEEAFIRAKAAYEAEQVDQMQRTRHIIDVSFVTVISGLIVIVIYLLLRGQ